jgi:hypothetical protein
MLPHRRGQIWRCASCSARLPVSDAWSRPKARSTHRNGYQSLRGDDFRFGSVYGTPLQMQIFQLMWVVALPISCLPFDRSGSCAAACNIGLRLVQFPAFRVVSDPWLLPCVCFLWRVRRTWPGIMPFVRMPSTEAIKGKQIFGTAFRNGDTPNLAWECDSHS